MLIIYPLYLCPSSSFLSKHFAEHGAIFQTHLDFSGYYLLARRVVCVQLDSLTGRLQRQRLHLMGTVGYYGPSCISASKVPQLAHILLNDRESIPIWEQQATGIIQKFLQRLIYESTFSFADKVNQ
ncbi:hypothetical protein EON65_40510 [archaeon]|nr:MAG: hypothetical protein EON65_40510 [archaeon]